MTLPIIHRNGTSRDQLLDQVCAVGRALTEALDKMALAAPNARDYYLEPGRWERAVAEYAARVELLKTVRQDYMGLAEGISDVSPCPPRKE